MKGIYIYGNMEKRQEGSHPVGQQWPWKNVELCGVKDDSHTLLLYSLTILGEALINLFLRKPKITKFIVSGDNVRIKY